MATVNLKFKVLVINLVDKRYESLSSSGRDVAEDKNARILIVQILVHYYSLYLSVHVSLSSRAPSCINQNAFCEKMIKIYLKCLVFQKFAIVFV